MLIDYNDYFPIKSPNTVMANALDDPIDLITSRIELSPEQPKTISFYVGTQINGLPHIGTYLVQAMAFHLAEQTFKRTGIPARVSFGALDNAPYEIMKNKRGEQFQLTYRDALGDSEIKKVIEQHYTQYFRDLSRYTNIPYEIQTYTEQQATPEYREEFLRILPKLSKLGIALSPSKKHFKIRIPNPINRLTEKHANNTKLLEFDDNRAVFESLGFGGDYYKSLVTSTNANETYIDINTLGRNLIKELVCMRKVDEMSIMIKGGDWMTGSSLVDFGHGVAGKRADRIPLRVYAPQIVTPEGAKLSKTLINEGHQSSTEIPEYFLDMSKFRELFPNVAGKMLSTSKLFASDAKHLFRSYSYKEMERILKTDSRYIMAFKELVTTK